MQMRFSSCCSTATPGGAGESLIRSIFSGAEQAVPVEVGALLEHCRPFRTLDDHISFIANGSSGDTRPLRALRTCLEGFAKAGFFLSERQLLELVDEHSGESTPCQIQTIAVPTYNRNASLADCLRSFHGNARRFGRAVAFFVVDDAREPQGAAKTYAALQALAGEGLQIRYTDRQLRKRYADQLVRHSGLRRELVEFALCDHGRVSIQAGAARNAILLETLGEALLSIDHDVFCRTARPPDDRPGLRISDRYDATEKWFFLSSEQTIASVAELPEDLLAAHEARLGASLSRCVAEAHDDSAELELDPEMVDHLARGSGRIGITQGAFYGDSGTNDSGFFWMSGESRRRLIEGGEAFYCSVVESRQVFVGASQETVTPAGLCVGHHHTIDNRHLVPPYLPQLRGADNLFAWTLSRCFWGVYEAHIPVAIYHKPAQARRQSFDAIWAGVERLALTNIVQLLLDHFATEVRTTEAPAALRQLGERLRESASREVDFNAFLRERAVESASWTIEAIERQMTAEPDMPGFFRDLLVKLRHTTELASRRDDYTVPRQAAGLLGEDEAKKFVRQLVESCGGLLEHWPEIVRAANELRDQGIRLSQEVPPR